MKCSCSVTTVLVTRTTLVPNQSLAKTDLAQSNTDHSLEADRADGQLGEPGYGQTATLSLLDGLHAGNVHQVTGLRLNHVERLVVKVAEEVICVFLKKGIYC